MRDVAEICSHLDARRPSLDWLNIIEQRATLLLEIDAKRPGAMYLNEARQFYRLAQMAIEQNEASAAALSAMGAVQAAWQAEIIEGRKLLDLGVKRYRQNKKQNADRSLSAEERHQQWQHKAAQIQGASSRKLSKSEIARKIDLEHWNYIRKLI